MSALINFLKDPSLSKVDKIDRLIKLRNEARDQQRADTEAGMTAPPDKEALDLAAIDKALQDLGVKVDSPEDNMGATL